MKRQMLRGIKDMFCSHAFVRFQVTAIVMLLLQPKS